MSLWIYLLFFGFIFLISYDPQKGTLHTKFIEGKDKVGAIYNV
tara:strand:+ start:686 stop:814 length:129 start_codon:yes stop_codon:yes gene_type:complete